MKGLYNKYIVAKTDGTPIASNAQYFVLRVDTDSHARVALGAYADSLMANFRVGTGNALGGAKLAIDIRDWLAGLTLNGE